MCMNALFYCVPFPENELLRAKGVERALEDAWATFCNGRVRAEKRAEKKTGGAGNITDAIVRVSPASFVIVDAFSPRASM